MKRKTKYIKIINHRFNDRNANPGSYRIAGRNHRFAGRLLGGQKNEFISKIQNRKWGF